MLVRIPSLLFHNMNKTQQIIKKSYEVSSDPYRSLQIDLKYNHLAREFMEHLISLADIVLRDELRSVHRTSTDKSVEWILNKIDHEDDLIPPGIKIVHNSRFTMAAYQQWEDGYIEGFLRIFGGLKNPDYFIWTYIRIKHLEEVIEKWKDHFDLRRIKL